MSRNRPEDPDEATLRAIARGEGDAVAELIDRYLTKVFGLGVRMLGSEMEAEEVAQEVFTKVWQEAPQWRFGDAQFKSWVYRVTTNLCLDRLKKSKELLPGELPEKMDLAPLADEVLEDEERRRRIDAAVLSLPERQRLAITLSHMHEMSNAEVAQAMGTSIEAVESLLARGRRSLRTILWPERQELLGTMKRGSQGDI